MCDTFVITSEATADGVTLFGKNSDRQPNEAHHLLHVPASDHPAGSRVQCTYIDVPQVEHTYAVLLAKPFWIWGAEMGTNEHGVTIGNEAVFTKLPYEKEGGLIGMDLLRLALERAATARQGVTVITDLLAERGQGGNCAFQGELHYHNSFLIADPQEAWVLETAGPHWAARQVEGVYTISNCLTIGNEWDLASPHLVEYAVERGWCRSSDDFEFARCYSDFFYTTFSYGRPRRRRSMELFAIQYGQVTISDVMGALRDHGHDEGPDAPSQGLLGGNICMHAGWGPVRTIQTTGSMASHLDPKGATHFFTATAAPCTGIFKPAWIDAGLPDLGPTPKGTYDEEALYWRHEALHRATLRDYRTYIGLYRDDRDALEEEFVQGALERASAPARERAAYSAQCFAEADAAEERWLEGVSASEPSHGTRWLYGKAWDRFNRQAEMPETQPTAT